MGKKFSSLFQLASILILTLTFQQNFAQSDSSEIKESQFVFPHTINKLFSVQNSRIMNSLDFSVQLGGSFGFEKNNGFLGSLGLGLGGYGDIEISSESLLGTMFNSKEFFTSIRMKIKIFSESSKMPAIVIGIKANNDWNSSHNDDYFIRTSETSFYDAGLRTANYDSRMTSLFATVGKTVNPKLTLHAGVDIGDLRYKNVYTVYNEGNSSYSNENIERKTAINFFGGFEYVLSNRTIFMFEIQSYSYLNVSTKDGRLNPDKRIVGTAGLRFFITKWLLLDSGVRYQDNYTGLADAELRIGLNGLWNFGF